MTPYQKAVQILDDLRDITSAKVVIEEIKTHLRSRGKDNQDWQKYREDNEDMLYWDAVLLELENAKNHINQNKRDRIDALKVDKSTPTDISPSLEDIGVLVGRSNRGVGESCLPPDFFIRLERSNKKS